MTALLERALHPDNRPYQPFGSQRDLFYCKRSEVVLSGPAGTGKSRACLEKLHACAEKYAGMRGLILRKTRESLSEAALVTFEEKVLPVRHAAQDGAGRHHRQVYSYPNGSQLVVGGLDKPGKIMSTEYDMAYVQEAIELDEEDWQAITTRLRNGVMPYQQIIADTNPGPPKHWLKQREAKGLLLMLESRHEDNPVLYDHARGQWTERGQVYIRRLQALTGVMGDRLYRGLWVGAEGVVYTEYDPRVHLIDPRPPSNRLEQYCILDPAYRAPCGILFGEVDGLGGVYLWAEHYDRETAPRDHLKNIAGTLRANAIDPHRVRFLMDPAAWNIDQAGRQPLVYEWIDEAERLGYGWFVPEKANNDKTAGIQRVKRYLRCLDERGYPVRPRLRVARTLTNWQSEIAGYIWKPERGSIVQEERPEPEEPIKRNDHLMDAMRYLINAQPEPESPPGPPDRLNDDSWLPIGLRSHPKPQWTDGLGDAGEWAPTAGSVDFYG